MLPYPMHTNLDTIQVSSNCCIQQIPIGYICFYEIATYYIIHHNPLSSFGAFFLKF